MMKKPLRLICLALIVLAVSLPAFAADKDPYPSKVVTLIVPFSAGGPSDTVARLLAQAMSASLKTQVIVENVGGAGGTIGAARAAKARPDGYTLFVHHIGHATAPSLYRNLPYDPIRDFEPIGLINDGAMTLVAKKDFPAQNLKERLSGFFQFFTAQPVNIHVLIHFNLGILLIYYGGPIRILTVFDFAKFRQYTQQGISISIPFRAAGTIQHHQCTRPYLGTLRIGFRIDDSRHWRVITSSPSMRK